MQQDLVGIAVPTGRSTVTDACGGYKFATHSSSSRYKFGTARVLQRFCRQTIDTEANNNNRRAKQQLLHHRTRTANGFRGR
jgi:hypothetical protein